MGWNSTSHSEGSVKWGVNGLNGKLMSRDSWGKEVNYPFEKHRVPYFFILIKKVKNLNIKKALSPLGLQHLLNPDL